MSEYQYFEQFTGDVDEIELLIVPMSVKEFMGFDELKREQVLSIAQSLMIPKSIWDGQHNA